MSMIGAVKDVVVGKAMRLMSDPRLSRMMGDPRVMNAAMKAMSVGGNVKAEFDRASRFAASVLGLATQEEVSTLRSTIQALEDALTTIEAKAETKTAHAGSANGALGGSAPARSP
jgi:hypothetical protein